MNTDGEKFWNCGRVRFSRARPLVMGVVNVTPDSFSDGGCFLNADAAVSHGMRLAEAGADLVDVGGESTRPGASPVSADAEKRRVLPAVEKLSARGVAVSADTMKPSVMRAALESGAVAINDVNAFRARGAVSVVAESDCGVVATHMSGTPRTMQDAPRYDDVVSEVRGFLLRRAKVLESAGVSRDRICLDPGIGFGKTLSHNLSLLRNVRELGRDSGKGSGRDSDSVRDSGKGSGRDSGSDRDSGKGSGFDYPILIGASRKSILGLLTGRKSPTDRDAAGSALAALLFANGAWGIRTHDPSGVRDALAVASALADD